MVILFSAVKNLSSVLRKIHSFLWRKVRFTCSEDEQKLLHYAAEGNYKFLIVSFWSWFFITELNKAEIGELFRGTCPQLRNKKNKKNAILYSIRSSGTYRCFSELVSWMQPFMCYLCTHLAAASTFFCLGYCSLWRDLLFFFTMYKLAGIHFKGLLITVKFGANLGWGVLVRCLLWFTVCRS